MQDKLDAGQVEYSRDDLQDRWNTGQVSWDAEQVNFVWQIFPPK